MAKRDQMLRLMTVISFLRNNKTGASFNEISKYLEEKNYQDSEIKMAFSEKTFQRDRKIMEELLGVEIAFNRSTMTFQITSDLQNDKDQTIFDSVLLVEAYRQIKDNDRIMYFEKRQASGLEHLDGMIKAIKNNNFVSFLYTKHLEGKAEKKIVEPYALKEFRNRWYLLANEKDKGNFQMKAFGLDRISNVSFTHSVFKKKDVDIEAMFVNSFGIISTLDQEPTTVLLSFDPKQSMFVKSLPIHHSQKILLDTDNAFTIALTLVPTYDFYQELLTHSERLLSIEPSSVHSEYLKILQKGINNLKK